jgi:hypothetical protein
MRRILGLTIVLVLLYSVPAGACTTFAGVDESGFYMVKSYDWHTQAGMVIANRKGIYKHALAFPFSYSANGQTMTTPTIGIAWTSKYNSVTFNQYGREFPNGGMNEKGLVVDETEMEPAGDKSGTAYIPDIPGGPTEATNTNQWEQYILDTFSSVDEFLNSLPPTFAIMPNTVPIQLLICDSTQKCAIAWIQDNKIHTIPDPKTGADFYSWGPNGPNIPIIVLANDYYDCSVNGGTNGSSDNNTVALTDYDIFGGYRLESDLGTGGRDYCQNLPAGDWCDYACRKGGKNWADSNSVERFVRAAYTIATLPLNITPVFAQEEVNNVFSYEDTAGQTMWQIIYHPGNLTVQWRTVMDGSNPDSGLTGPWRWIDMHDPDLIDGTCTDRDDEIVNIDSSPGCGTGSLCNPNPDLPSCPQSMGESILNLGSPPPPCTMSPYGPDANYNLVRFAASQPGVDTDEFVKMVQKAFPAIGDHAPDMLYSIWGGYPEGFTACGGDIAPEDIANLYLKSATPYLDVASYTKGYSVPYDKKDHWGPFSYEVKGSFSGLENTRLKSMSVTAGSPTDVLSINGDILPQLQTTGKVTLSANVLPCITCNSLSYCAAHIFDPKYCPASVTGTVTVSFPVNDFNIGVGGAHTSYDDMKAICFDKDLPVKHFGQPSIGHINCSVNIDLGPLKILGVSADFLCDSVFAASSNLIAGSVNAALDYLAPTVAGNSLPECGDNLTVEAPAPAPAPTLTAGWGGLEGQYVTARAGHTYALDGIVNSDQATYSHKFVSFSEIAPGSTHPARAGIVRMTWQKGDNTVGTMWTPGSAGDYDLSFRISREDEQTDDVTSSVLHVHVLPSGGPTSWLDLTNEGLSSKLKEVK